MADYKRKSPYETEVDEAPVEEAPRTLHVHLTLDELLRMMPPGHTGRYTPFLALMDGDKTEFLLPLDFD